MSKDHWWTQTTYYEPVLVYNVPVSCIVYWPPGYLITSNWVIDERCKEPKK